MFNTQNPSDLKKPWRLSKRADENVVEIPEDVTRMLQNFHIIGIEYLYHNYRKGIKGSILNVALEMNVHLQISTLFRVLLGGPALMLIICAKTSYAYWHYYLINYGNFEVKIVTSKNCSDSYDGVLGKIALVVFNDDIKLCEELSEQNFSSIVIENLDQFVLKRAVKKLNGNFKVGITYRNFYKLPDQKLLWNMLNWVNPGCVGKLKSFSKFDDDNLYNLQDNYSNWWLRLTWQFCESFRKPSDEEISKQNEVISQWASDNKINCLMKPLNKRKCRKRKLDTKIKDPKKLEEVEDNISDVISENSSDNTIIYEIPKEEYYAEMPRIADSSIVDNLKNIVEDDDYEDSVISSILDNVPKASASRSESEDFILNLI